ncbi:DUF1036 domain-containing protein [Paenibacillus albidus]|uniref:DUF1036 domain-containing protein n=1 Tax=Paenibacillus albidus TaxID=2041023 RepID=UPI001E352734|nr:DUF1036 domain-containing protein [Paenibacillus albidus]
MTTMGLNFRNSTNATVFVAYAYPNFNCSPVNYAKIGWYRIEPGQTREVWSGFAGGNTFFYYAESSFGRTWPGAYFTQLPTQAFHWCWNTGCTTCRNLGMRRIQVGSTIANYTVVLITSSSQRQSGLSHLRTELPTSRKAGRPLLRRVPKRAGKMAKGRAVSQRRVSLPRKIRRS